MATNLQFIKSASGSSVSSLSVTDCFSADYDVYAMTIPTLDQNSTATFVYLQYLDSSNTEITSASYDRAFLVTSAWTTFAEQRATNQTQDWVVAYNQKDTYGGMGAVMYFFNPYDSSSYTFQTQQSSFIYGGISGGGGFDGYKGIGVLKSAQQVNGIKLFNASTHTFDNIEVNIYGVK